ncbi:MAG: SLBB domain-containing protein [Desulfobacterales bacterium]
MRIFKKIESYRGYVFARRNPAASFFMPILFLVFLFLPNSALGQEYKVGEGDLLKITVYDNPDLDTQARVGGDGGITVPLIGEVEVNGLTVAEIGKRLAGFFANGYIKNPQISVFILEYKSKKVTVLGEFTKPGLVEMRGESTLMEVISSAGGITAAAGDTLFIQRNISKGSAAPKNDITIPINLMKLLEGGDLSLNIPVLDGDSIYVPKAAFVYVSGEVKNPGAYKITKGLTVLRSITLAGGFTQKARKSKAEIIRKSVEGEVTIAAQMDDLVLPDDIIVVPESIF